MYLMDISTLPTLPQNTGGEHIYTIVEMDGEGAECVCVPATDSCYIHLAGKRRTTTEMQSYTSH